MIKMYFKLLVIAIVMFFLSACKEEKKLPNKASKTTSISIDVTATAYNSIERQTKKGNPTLAAWGDILKAGERAIAVSRDLIKLGLDHNEEVEIEGLPGIYIVKDKMNKRWSKKIDIYMGLDEEAARIWGKKNVTITFNPFDEKGKFDR